MKQKSKKKATDARSNTEFASLVMIASRLRRDCPWDRVQTLEKFCSFIENESDEMMQAVRNNDIANLQEELGDVFFNILMVCAIAQEKQHFTLAQVLTDVREKIVRRHPHVYCNEKAATPRDVERIWKRVKDEEKRRNKK